MNKLFKIGAEHEADLLAALTLDETNNSPRWGEKLFGNKG